MACPFCGSSGGGRGDCATPVITHERDRVIIDDIERIVWKRGQLVFDYSNKEILQFFDCNKDTCLQKPARAGPGKLENGDILAFIFNDVVQLESAQMTRKQAIALQVGSQEIITDIIGDWIAYHPDGTFTAEDASKKLQVHKKTSVVEFIINDQTFTGFICEAVFKTFTHADVTVTVGPVEVELQSEVCGGTDSVAADLRVGCDPVTCSNPVPTEPSMVVSAGSIEFADADQTEDEDAMMAPAFQAEKIKFIRLVEAAQTGTAYTSYDFYIYDKTARTPSDLRFKATGLVPDADGILIIQSLVAELMYRDRDGSTKLYLRFVANGGDGSSESTVAFDIEGESECYATIS